MSLSYIKIDPLVPLYPRTWSPDTNPQRASECVYLGE